MITLLNKGLEEACDTMIAMLVKVASARIFLTDSGTHSLKILGLAVSQKICILENLRVLVKMNMGFPPIKKVLRFKQWLISQHSSFCRSMRIVNFEKRGLTFTIQ